MDIHTLLQVMPWLIIAASQMLLFYRIQIQKKRPSILPALLISLCFPMFFFDVYYKYSTAEELYRSSLTKFFGLGIVFPVCLFFLILVCMHFQKRFQKDFDEMKKKADITVKEPFE